MDMKKMKDEEKLDLCRKYFLVGFAFLPLLWLLNFFWFFEQAFRRPSFDQQPKIRQYVIFSGVGALIWTVIIVAWNIYFQTNRTSVSWGDSLSFILPTGIP